MWRKRLELYLTSRRNIAGCVGGVGGIGLLLFGITSGGVGLGIVAGLYVIGYLAARPEQGVGLSAINSGDSDDIKRGLERLLASIRFRVTDDVYQRVGLNRVFHRADAARPTAELTIRPIRT